MNSSPPNHDHPAPRLCGLGAQHPDAIELARRVQAHHFRYAAEVVGAHGLCPFMTKPHLSFGAFIVVCETSLNVDTALKALVDAGDPVVHLVYPLVDSDCRDFEAFANAVHKAAETAINNPPVHATFHPRFPGGRDGKGQRVGLVRRAPDPFIQFVPAGLQPGGTTFLDPAALELITQMANLPKKHVSRVTELSDDDLDQVETRLAALHTEREELYGALARRLSDPVA